VSSSYQTIPFFLKNKQGNIFSIYYTPDKNFLPTQFILHIPAFAEEMNKSRHMVAMQAQELAKQGVAVLVFDLYGTGDSEGCFSDSSWSIWKQNITTACQWLMEQGAQSITLWGLRSGALLALDYAQDATHEIKKILLWQPVLNGETFILQFLRLRIAAKMMDQNAGQEKTSELKLKLQKGQPIVVAGYTLSPDLANPIMALRANKIELQNTNEIFIFEIVKNFDTSISIANHQFSSDVKNKNTTIKIHPVVGNTFWSTQEITHAPKLLRATLITCQEPTNH